MCALAPVEPCVVGPASHLGRLLAGLTVQAAYPPALHHLVVIGARLHLLPLKCGTVAGFQIGLLPWGLILGCSFNGLHRFHILISLELSPDKNRKHKQLPMTSINDSFDNHILQPLGQQIFMFWQFF